MAAKTVPVQRVCICNKRRAGKDGKLGKYFKSRNGVKWKLSDRAAAALSTAVNLCFYQHRECRSSLSAADHRLLLPWSSINTVKGLAVCCCCCCNYPGGVNKQLTHFFPAEEIPGMQKLQQIVWLWFYFTLKHGRIFSCPSEQSCYTKNR